MIQVNTFSHLFSIFFTFLAKSMHPACILLENLRLPYVRFTSDDTDPAQYLILNLSNAHDIILANLRNAALRVVGGIPAPIES